MNIETLKELLTQSELPPMQKSALNGFLERAKQDREKHNVDINLIHAVSNNKNIHEIVLSNDDVKIYTVYGTEEWDTKYPYRSIYLSKKGVWQRSTTVSPSFDIAFLVYLQYKHLGDNSQFVDFAMKMLEMPNPE
jgi:hypothetical protein